MFIDDRSRLRQIDEWLGRLRDGLDRQNPMADEVAWWRLSMVEQACSHLSAAYRADHPQIAALGLPTLDEALKEPPPDPAVAAELARRAIEVFCPLLVDLPPSPPDQPATPNPNSRFQEVASKLGAMESHLRSQGISALYLFGSVARREDRPGSDVDLAFVIAADAVDGFSVFDQSRVRREIATKLELDVDMVEEAALRGETRARYARDRVVIYS